MIRQVSAAALAGLLFAGIALAQQGDTPPRWGVLEPRQRLANLARLQHVAVRGLPASYASLRDPLPDTPAKLRRGAELWDRNCAACHGPGGQGDGEAGQMLVASPADLQWLAGAPAGRSGPYMYWAIAEGGRAFGSDMPAFKSTLSRNEIWAIVSYVRAGLPARGRATLGQTSQRPGEVL